MSRLRPEIKGTTREPALPDTTALYGIYGAVQSQSGLCHGRLHDGHGAHCAIGSFWTVSGGVLRTALIDEVAAINDSVPHLSNQKRKAHVLRWLRWKLKTVGVPGFQNCKQP